MRSPSFAPFAILFGVIVLITYGSLFPFEFDGSDFANRLQESMTNLRLWTSKGDVLGNVGLFVPFGAAGIWAFRRLTNVWMAAAITLISGIAFAAGLQVLQVLVPTRSPAIADILWNGFGVGIGLTIGIAAQGRELLRRDAIDTQRLLSLILVGTWAMAELLPLVPTLDWQQIKENLKPIWYARKLDLSDTLLLATEVLLVGALLRHAFARGRTVLILGGLLAAVLFGKVISARSTLDLATVAGFAVGFVASGVLHWRTPRRAVPISVLACVTALTISAFTPFKLVAFPAEIHWIPFESFLEGGMLDNARSLLASMFRYGAMLLLVWRTSGHVIGVGTALAFWVALIEIGQIWIAGHTADLTQPLLVIAIATAIKLVAGDRAPRQSVQTAPTPARTPSAPSPVPLPPRAGSAVAAFSWKALLPLAGVSLAIAVCLFAVLRLPGIPYNVRELFLLDGWFPVLVLFALATLWPGLGTRWAAHRLALSNRPILALPLLWFLVAMGNLLLLFVSVTEESLLDICGSNNLFWFVTNRSTWGESARSLFLAINSPEFVAFFERPVRFAALFGPLVILLTMMFAIIERRASRGLDWRWMAGMVAVAIPLLWLCKMIAFTWSSTDNLNELIARPGPWSIRGGAYLWVLLVVLCFTAVIVSRARSAGTVALAAGMAIGTLPVTWWLLNAGLNPTVHKYGLVFSGAQFLLGPDRSHLLDSGTLFLRWSVIHLGFVLLIAFAAVQAENIAGLRRASGRPASDRTLDALPAESMGRLA